MDLALGILVNRVYKSSVFTVLNFMVGDNKKNMLSNNDVL